ncbi:hypothetical protein BJX63DRAFT_187513 [Aspergillus granulosus]|uniref:Uncharacterized protein n=1 Tax=Aspergillus granulosus TaxID=176169 RepID=A0ABR4HJU4_9EURO
MNDTSNEGSRTSPSSNLTDDINTASRLHNGIIRLLHVIVGVILLFRCSGYHALDIHGFSTCTRMRCIYLHTYARLSNHSFDSFAHPFMHLLSDFLSFRLQFPDLPIPPEISQLDFYPHISLFYHLLRPASIFILPTLDKAPGYYCANVLESSVVTLHVHSRRY